MRLSLDLKNIRKHQRMKAIRQHKFTHPLSLPGQCDLTADVDFGALAAVVANEGIEVELRIHCIIIVYNVSNQCHNRLFAVLQRLFSKPTPIPRGRGNSRSPCHA